MEFEIHLKIPEFVSCLISNLIFCLLESEPLLRTVDFLKHSYVLREKRDIMKCFKSNIKLENSGIFTQVHVSSLEQMKIIRFHSFPFLCIKTLQ